MEFREMLQRLMQQNMQQQQDPQKYMSDSEQMMLNLNRMQQNRLRQVQPEQMQMLQQQLPQSAPAASPEMMMERGGMGALPNAFLERLQQMQQQQVPPNSLGLGYGVQR